MLEIAFCQNSRGYVSSIIQAYSDWVRNSIKKGWNGYLVSILFHDLPGTQTVKIDQMRQAATKMYTRLVTRMVRNPRSEKWRPYLPKAIFSTDLPIRKDAKRSTDDDITNNGLHMHGIHPRPSQCPCYRFGGALLDEPRCV